MICEVLIDIVEVYVRYKYATLGLGNVAYTLTK
jgi:hypothetical protein